MIDQTYWREFWVCNECKYRVKYKNFGMENVKIINMKPVAICPKCNGVGTMKNTRIMIVGDKSDE